MIAFEKTENRLRIVDFRCSIRNQEDDFGAVNKSAFYSKLESYFGSFFFFMDPAAGILFGIVASHTSTMAVLFSNEQPMIGAT